MLLMRISIDIGTDVDDALALLMLLNFPLADVDLLGITTVCPSSFRRIIFRKHIGIYLFF